MTPVTPHPPAHPGDELFWLLRRALHTMRRDVREQVDLTPSRHRALRVVARSPEPQRQTTLAAALDVVPRSVTSLVDDLEGAGLVERRPDPTDGRATLVSITDAGREYLAQRHVLRARQVAARVERLAEADRSALLAAATALTHLAAQEDRP